jgi:hypothetical protein
MNIFILIALSFIGLFAQNELTSIEDSYKEASKRFTVQKNEHNITKLLAITKILYDNNKKLKELKSKYAKKLNVKLISDKPLDKLQVDDVVELQVETSHSISEEYAKSDLNFFIYDGKELLATKNVALYEKGGVHKESLKFKITEPSDKYKICAVFKEEGKEYKECKYFGVVQFLVAKPIITSTALEATTSDKVLSPNRDFFLFMPFENKSDITLEGKIEIVDSGNVIFSKDFKKEPVAGFKKAGVLVPASLLHEKQNLHVKISLKGEGINSIEKEKDVHISAFEWSVIFPKKLEAKRDKNFVIIAPKFFVKPLHVEINPNGGVLISHKNNELKGTISAVTNKKENASVDISVVDANGEKVQKRIEIKLNQDFVEQKISKTVPISSKKQFVVKYDFKKYIFNVCCKGKTRLYEGAFIDNYRFGLDDEIIKYFKKYVINNLTIYDENGIKLGYYKFNNGKVASIYIFLTSGWAIGKVDYKVAVYDNDAIYTDYDTATISGKHYIYKEMEEIYKKHEMIVTHYQVNGTIRSICSYDLSSGDEIKCSKF